MALCFIVAKRDENTESSSSQEISIHSMKTFNDVRRTEHR